jgi:protein-S-isoprenylcysteine O-methyltransferase Ste14
MTLQRTVDYVKQNRQQLFNIYLAVNIAGWVVWQIYKMYRERRLDYIEISFAAQNVMMMIFVLVRIPHRGLDRKLLNQLVAITAFCSGLAFMGQPAVENSTLAAVSTAVIFFSNVLGIVTLLNLGRSFGVLIAFREVKTHGLYAFVRHPMYGTDILLRTGYIISHLNLFTAVVFVLSTGCYVYRALLEEKFLSQQEEYRQYKEKVRYRFLPFIF